MITFECPWCTEPGGLELVGRDELACAGCAITVEIASDPGVERVAQAA